MHKFRIIFNNPGWAGSAGDQALQVARQYVEDVDMQETPEHIILHLNTNGPSAKLVFETIQGYIQDEGILEKGK